MRGGLERWKRGVGSRGVGQAIDYALKGTCDAHLHLSTGSDALELYSNAPGASVTRFVATEGAITADELSAGALRVWLTGHDPVTGEEHVLVEPRHGSWLGAVLAYGERHPTTI